MNEKEFSSIVAETKKVVLTAIGKTLDPEFADYLDDVVQETYLRAFSALSKNKFKNEAKLSTWLYQIARNESLRMNKKLIRENKNREEIDMASLQQAEPENAQNTANPDYQSMVHLLIDKLPDKYRSVMELDMQGYRDNQIAEKLNISLGTVKSRNSRAREQLRRMVHQVDLLESV